MYSETVAIQAFLERNPSITDEVYEQPLTGIVGGDEVRLRLPTPPALAGTVEVIDSSGATVTPASVNEDSGLVVLATPPSDYLYASYTHCELTNAKLLGLFKAGFAKMEEVFPRGYFLYSDSGVLVVSSSSTAAVDPVVADTTFSARATQYGLLLWCMDYQYALAGWREATAHGFMTREKLAVGIQIDRQRQPESYRSLVEAAERAIEQAVVAAMSDADAVGGIDVVAPRADPYENLYATALPIPSSVRYQD